MRNYRERIEINPRILLGKPVFKGTRIPLYVILDLLAEGTPVKKIIKFYPDLTEEDIRAAMRFASDSARHIAEIVLLQDLTTLFPPLCSSSEITGFLS